MNISYDHLTETAEYEIRMCVAEANMSRALDSKAEHIARAKGAFLLWDRLVGERTARSEADYDRLGSLISGVPAIGLRTGSQPDAVSPS